MMPADKSGIEPARASLAKYLSPLAEPLLDPRLVSRAAWSHCLTVADAIPGEATFGMLGLEVRLGDNSAVDLLLCALRAAGGHRWLPAVTRQQAGGLPPGPWHAINAFAQTWNDGRLADRIDCVWLEFDSSERPRTGVAHLSAPSVFSSTSPTEVRRDAPTPDVSSATDMLEVLLAEGLPPGSARTLAEIEQALPSESQIFQVGAMLSRSRPVVRICVSGPGGDALRAVLGRLGWPEPANEVERLLGTFDQLSRILCLDLDVTPSGLGATAGIEVYVSGPGERADASQWPPLLDRLETLKLATPTKHAALETYPRIQVSTGLLDRLPRQYAHAATLLAAQRAGRFIAHLHHVKITVSAHGPRAAKAYLALWHEWN
jgi:hypothetical protein